MPKSKKNIKVRDLKPTKDAKGGFHKAVSGAGKATGSSMGKSHISGAKESVSRLD